MRNLFTTAMLVGALTAVPVIGFAATPARTQSAAKQPQSAAKRSSNAAVPSHATTGVVKSVDATTLVITRSGKKASEMTFVLSPSTHREGTVEIGSPVSVRYRAEGQTNVAMAITAQHPKQQATNKVPPAR